MIRARVTMRPLGYMSFYSAMLLHANRHLRKALVKFIRKRDPRYKVYQASANQSKSVANVPSKQDAAAALRRAQASENYIEQEWQKVDSRHLHTDLEWAVAEGADDEAWECVICNKIFRSEAAWDSHERSKKHLKEVERLHRRMLEENEALGLEGNPEDLDLNSIEGGDDDAAVEVAPEPSRSASPSIEFSTEVPETLEDIGELPRRNLSSEPAQPTEKRYSKKISGSKESTLEPMSKTERRAMRRNQRSGSEEGTPEPNGVDEGQPEEDIVSQTLEPSKRNKRRVRQAKKAEAATSASKQVCCCPSFQTTSD